MRETIAKKNETRERLERARRIMDDKAAMVPAVLPPPRALFVKSSGKIEYARGVSTPATEIYAAAAAAQPPR